LADAQLSYDTNVSTAQKALEQAEVNYDNAIIVAENTLSTARLSQEQQISSAQAQIDSTYKAWQIARAQLDKIKAPARSEDIALAQGQVKQAQAELASVNNQINNSIIKSPIDGVITKSNYEVGEDVSQTKPVFVLLGKSMLYTEIDISEADINKITVSNPVEITLDAFGDEVKFQGNVTFIDPAETIIQDVIYYKVKVYFNQNSMTALTKNSAIKSGMTANAIITTAEKSDILIAPERAIIEKNSQKIARILLPGNQIKESVVTTGLRGDNGLIEILSGLNEGDEVVTFIKAAK
jgi:RND family efflux transporter MFP subunit